MKGERGCGNWGINNRRKWTLTENIIAGSLIDYKKLKTRMKNNVFAIELSL